MTEAMLKALAHLQFNYTPTRNDVWHSPRFHVDGLHTDVLATVLDGLATAERSPDASPIGVAVRGQRGAGKTHLLSRVRELTQLRGGYFFLVNLLDANTFWRSVTASIVDGLHQPVDGEGTTQLHAFLERLTNALDLPVVTRMAVTGRAPMTPDRADAFVAALGGMSRQIGIGCRDAARALALLASPDQRVQDIGMSYLLAADEAETGERAAWGIRPTRRLPQELVSDVSRLLAFTGPSIIAVDQVDGLIAQVANRSHVSATPTENDTDSWHAAVLLDQVAGGLMELRELTWRTVTVLALLPVSWSLIKTNAVDTVQDRFRETATLESIPDASVGRALIERRLAAHYEEVGFAPPYPTWPVRPEAFADAPDFTPRQLLINVERHIRSCVLSGEVTEMTTLTAAAETLVPAPMSADRSSLRPLDERYAALREQAQIDGLLDPASEDTEIPSLLAAALDAWIREGADTDFDQDTIPVRKPVLHARLRRTLDERTGDEAHWAFRAIAAQHYNAELARLRNACDAAGLAHGVAQRRLFILRNEEWSESPGRRKAVEAFVAAGGRTLPLGEDDLRSLVALRTLLAEEPDGLQAWLVERRPASSTALLATALADAGREIPAGGVPHGMGESSVPPAAGDADAFAAEVVPAEASPADAKAPVTQIKEFGEPSGAPAEPVAAATPAGVYLRLGDDFDQGDPIHVELSALRKHTAIFAGSGSGKTVLIRRLVEECALLGVSAIVLDPNNDLARLGDAWPDEPHTWGDADEQAAADYLESTDVVVWTPGREGGRPLTFQPLPDFSGVCDDPDEFTQAVDSAVDALAPRAQVSANTAKALRGQAVLRQALRHYGRQGGPATLSGLIDLLRDLPDGVSELTGAVAIAADLAENLEAARINDPLFGGTGESADPGTLLTPAPGKRARVSVISFVGLPGDEKRQGFVNQLQMALFSWIKRNPARDRPLGGLLVMDEAQTLAPSGPVTACTRSTLMLASQARKYGLGLIFATQAPKGLHSQIPGNAATQFFGLLNAPVHIEAAREMARFKGGDLPEISRLSSGQFYVAVEGQPFRKARTPLCLSHHPASPLSPEDVIARARRLASPSDDAATPV
ncbi:ATP-binding protein [Phytohabitans sp. ZYX-F-186]|uniref:ATP-binding protein n=1 Tax=Phytohabitans maris TaxID=3071409 RepID=A0ABU0ZW75_9ACTN|nr:ATP-binding protein [Phytohabitans sp. ZYX-F-186]MDQ7911185.1 ATP-binding protein [Phytohabitans sp. ZYX-F-186]